MSLSSSQYGIKYCTLCDEYFRSKDLLQQHMQASSRHPRCTTCKRNYLNMNSLRNHYVLSSRHHYCRACDKSFETASGLRVHLARSAVHNDDSDEEEAEENLYDGWEDDIARLEDEAARSNQTEEEIVFNESDDFTPISREAVMQKIKARANIPIRVISYNCPICLTDSEDVSSTRCGHVFCTPCIEQAIDVSGTCPTCRKPGLASQLRKLILQVF